ncbi:hypothetical protein L593_15135 [Salinarchaeum sp. Harcht-Bsk1]|uniref:DUF7546 family protein n=1 Tax=Salinarchaeum sp. Harcht-Bsk1 TaxID=1333523 RepID=UPI0003422A83|nr:hypothetical protein [Salinarchaeum sp. Harcht-Bsk1]AGN02961.1 hypothetical protein L593_15135 [Salinarchaeum sp. Harcht-Bsk1]
MHEAVSTLDARVPRPRKSTIVWGVVLVNVEALFVLTYLAITQRSYDLAFLLFPFVWINVGLWALVRTEPPSASTSRRRVAAGLSVLYFLALGFMGNMLALGPAFGSDTPATGFDFVMYGIQPPGWTPYLLFNSEFLHVSLIPPYVIGFAALTYLVYATVLDAASLAGVGIVGLFSCISCTMPLVAAVVTGAIGASSGALLSAVAPIAYEGGMVLYVVTVALLYYRPVMGDGPHS